MEIQMFPESLVALGKEVEESHPKILDLINLFTLENGKPPTQPQVIGIVAAYCGYVLDDVYKLDILCDTLVTKLKAMSSIIVTLH